MSLISDIETGVLERLDEANPSVFWDLTNELRMLVLESLCEATLLTGMPQFRQGAAPVVLAANTTFFPQPTGAFALLRMEVAAGQPVRKCSIWDLDLDNNGWQNATKQASPTEWFPLGLSGFGIRPQLTAPVNAIMTVVQNPVSTAPPYDGTQQLPFGSEFNIGFELYAAGWARFKEGSNEAAMGIQDYEQYLAVMAELSLFGLRADSLRFSKVMGTASQVDPVEKK